MPLISHLRNSSNYIFTKWKSLGFLVSYAAPCVERNLLQIQKTQQKIFQYQLRLIALDAEISYCGKHCQSKHWTKHNERCTKQQSVIFSKSGKSALLAKLNAKSWCQNWLTYHIVTLFDSISEQMVDIDDVDIVKSYYDSDLKSDHSKAGLITMVLEIISNKGEYKLARAQAQRHQRKLIEEQEWIRDNIYNPIVDGGHSIVICSVQFDSNERKLLFLICNEKSGKSWEK